MNEIIEILKSSFKITHIVIENFTLLDRDLTINITVSSNDFGYRTISFEGVSRININSEYYSSSDTSSIVIDDVTMAQMEDIFYNVKISEDVMTFNCKSFGLV